MEIRFKVRRGTSSEWASKNTILADGEHGLETDYDRFKIGDGVTPWNDLVPYYTNADDVDERITQAIIGIDSPPVSFRSLYNNAKAG